MASASKGLDLASLRRVRFLWKENVRRLTLAELHSFGCSNDGTVDQLNAAQRTHRELKLRIAHRLQDFLFLPYKVMANPSVRILYDRYVDAYQTHEELGRMDSPEAAAEYWVRLAQIFDDNRHLTRLLGHGRRQLIHLDPDLAPGLNAFCDRFFFSRLGTHLLGAKFLHMGPLPQGAKKPAGVAMGVLQPTRPADFVRDLAASFARSSPGNSVSVEVEDSMQTSLTYVPNHIRVVLRETLHNAMSATVREAAKRGDDPPPVRVAVNRGQFGVFVNISDQGGGVDLKDGDNASIWKWGPDTESELPPANDDDENPWPEIGTEDAASRTALLPLGFGLPLARLTARYFGGDLKLQSVAGYGTSAYIHIPELQEQGEQGVDDSMNPGVIF